MNKLFALVVACLVLILVVSAQPVAAITGGVEDGEGHPNVGMMVADIDGVPQWRCSGTLIAPRVFLTAGHCVGDGATAARVWFGSDLTDLPDYPYGGELAIEGTPLPYPEYLWGGGDPNDVGLVILDEAVTGIPFGTLPAPELLTQLKEDGILEGGYEDGVYFTHVGYGGTLAAFPHPVLEYDFIRRVSSSEYISMTKVYVHLSQKAVFDESGACFGDSGGPLFWTDPDGNEIIVAVTSAGDGTCVASSYNYRVDLPYILDWIYDQYPEE